MKEAFTFMFKDNLFKQKWAAYFCFAFLGSFLSNLGNAPAIGQLKLLAPLFILLGVVIMLVPAGYIVACIRALKEQKENYVLPLFNIKHNLFTGFKFGVSIFILSFLFGAVFAIISLIIGIISGILNAKLVAIIGISLIMIIAFAIVLYYTLALNRVFADTDSWISFIKFKHATELIKKSSQYTKGFWLFISINFLSGVISGILFALSAKSIGCLAITTIISAAIASYVAFFNAFITAKAVD